MKTNVYIDTFNLYYGLLKGSPYRWLDLHKLCQAELPTNQINRIRCFSARVISRPGDPDQRNRQNAYFRALETIPNLSMHLGHFLESEVNMRRVTPGVSGNNFALVKKTEEKGSDVNLASYLLLDGFNNWMASTKSMKLRSSLQMTRIWRNQSVWSVRNLSCVFSCCTHVKWLILRRALRQVV